MIIQHRRSTCHRHPSTPVTGFCAPCLSERLVGLDSAADAGPLELRRSKSCCSTRPDRPTSDLTRRKSCDVRNRSTLSELFHVDDDGGDWKRAPAAGMVGLEEAAAEEENGDEIRVSEAEAKTMKELIDLEMQRKKGNGGRDLRGMAGAVWETASKKVKQWRRKQKEKKQLGSSEVGEYALGRRSCDTEYALGRRSCDTDMDPGRMSLDEPHRASWDGYLSTRAYPRMTPMVAVAEDVKMNEEEVEEGLEGLERSPGGSAQTQDYYFSQARRRRSFERPSSCLPSKGMMVGEVEAVKVVDNDATGLFYGAKVVFTEKELMGSSSSNSKSLEEDCVAGGCGVGIEGICGNAGGVLSSRVDQMPQKWHKRWKFWGQQRKSEPKVEDESWDKLRKEANATVSQKLIRSYSVSCRKSCKMVGLYSNVSSVESKGNGLTTLQRNRSARYSPSNLDNGLLRFYLTPLRSFRKNESGKSRLQNNHSLQNLAKSMF